MKAKVNLFFVCLLSFILVYFGSGMVVVRCMTAHTARLAYTLEEETSCCSGRKCCQKGLSCMKVTMERLSPFSVTEREEVSAPFAYSIPLTACVPLPPVFFDGERESFRYAGKWTPPPRQYLNQLCMLLI